MRKLRTDTYLKLGQRSPLSWDLWDEAEFDEWEWRIGRKAGRAFHHPCNSQKNKVLFLKLKIRMVGKFQVGEDGDRGWSWRGEGARVWRGLVREAIGRNLDSILPPSITLEVFERTVMGRDSMFVFYKHCSGCRMKKVWGESRLKGRMEEDLPVLLNKQQNPGAFRNTGMGILCCHNNRKGGKGTKLPEMCLESQIMKNTLAPCRSSLGLL